MKILSISILLILSISLSACRAWVVSDPLAGTRWQLRDMDGRDLITGSVLTLEFKEQRMSGLSGCNSLAGGYQLTGDKIKIEALAMTEMACVDDGIMQQESAYVELLSTVETYQKTDEVLALLNADGKVVLSYVPVK
jgi:heat shock protein HslJ